MNMIEKVAAAIKAELKRQAEGQLEFDLPVDEPLYERYPQDLFVEAALDTQAIARAAIEALRPTNGQVLDAVNKWLSDPEGFTLRTERMPDTLEASWLRSAALVGAGVAFPVEEKIDEQTG